MLFLRPQLSEQSQKVGALKQGLGVAQRLFRLVLIIKTDQTNVATMDTTFSVDLIEPSHGSPLIVKPQLGGRPGERQRLSQNQLSLISCDEA